MPAVKLQDAVIASVSTCCAQFWTLFNQNNDYKDVSGFCYKAKFEEIEKNNFVLTPGRYVGAPEEDDDGEPFDDKMKRLTSLLKEQQEKGVKLDQQIAENLGSIGYE